MSGDPWQDAVGIALCLVLSALFSGSETALTSLTRAQTRQLMDDSGSGALRLWAERPLLVLVTILIWNNVVNVTSSALATRLVETLLRGAGAEDSFISPVAIAVGLMTLLLLTFGEITPKTIAKAHARTIAPYLMRVLLPFYFLSWPFAQVFLRITRLMGRAVGAPVDETEGSVSEADIEFLIRLGKREGSLTGERERLLRSVFEFTETTAREVMVPRTDVVFIPHNITEPRLLDVVVRAGHSRIPVFDGSIDNVVGIFHVRDLFEWQRRRKPEQALVITDLLRPSRFVPETKNIDELLREMQSERTHMAVVVDEFGGTSGVVTLEDIIEQFFGDIQDEFDHEDEWFIEESENVWRVDARIQLDDLAEHLDLEIDDGDHEFDTLGGYIASETGHIADPGTCVEGWGYRFTVLVSDLRRIRWVQVEKKHDRAEPGSAHAPTDAAETVDESTAGRAAP